MLHENFVRLEGLESRRSFDEEGRETRRSFVRREGRKMRTSRGEEVRGEEVASRPPSLTEVETVGRKMRRP